MAGARRFLLVAPSDMSTGEAITLAHVAEDLERAGASLRFLASAGARRLIEPGFAGRVQSFNTERTSNQDLWRQTIDAFRPQVIVFADYPLLFFASGAAPLADAGWVEELERTPAALFTLDHLGYAQRERIVPFGPPHMTFGLQVTPPLPARMRILLPCPIHDPSACGFRGTAFRAWSAMAVAAAERQSVRERLGVDGRGALVLHSTPAWAVHLARELGLPQHRYLAPLLAELFSGGERSVTIVSVNVDGLLAPDEIDGVRFVNLAPMPPAEFERLIAAADLVLTDNAIATSLGKAVCSGRPSALLANRCGLTELLERGDQPGARWAASIERERPGAIFPWDVFPIWSHDDLAHLGFGDRHPFRRTHARAEIFGGAATRTMLGELLEQSPARRQQAAVQSEYAARLAVLPDAGSAIAEALA